MSDFSLAAVDWAARGLLLSSLLALIVAAIWLAWGRRIQARWTYGLALLPLLPLVLPRVTTWDWQVSPASSWASVGERTGFLRSGNAPSLADGFAMAEVIEEVPAKLERIELGAPSGSELATESLGNTSSEQGFAWPNLLIVIWASVASALLFALGASIHRTERRLSGAQALDDASEARLRRLLPRRPGVRFLRSDAVSSPAAWGLRDKRVVLPLGLEDELDDAQLAWVLRHELAHHQRGDLWMSVLQRVVQIIWWFHPLLWWWQSRIELARECACDEAAARRLRRDSRPAATALLAVASRPSAPQDGALALHPLHRNARIMKTRLTRLLQPRTSRLAGFATATLCALLACGTLLLSQSVLATPSSFPEAVQPELAFESEASPLQETEPIEEPAPPEEIVEEPIEVEEVMEEVPSDADSLATQSVERTFRLQTDTVLRDAQLWLLKQQRKDGSWPTGEKTNQASGEFTSVGVTALALLALETRSLQIPEQDWKNAISRGVGFLGSCWDGERGLFIQGDSSSRTLPDHALATRAVLRFRGYGSGWHWGIIYSRSVETLLQARNPYGGWRYGLDPDGDNDSMMTSLVMLTLAESARHGEPIPPRAIECAQLFLDEMTDAGTGRVGYQKKGSADPRFHDRAELYPVQYTELCTAISTLARVAMGQDVLENEASLRSLTLIASKPPVWKLSNGSVDYYYWMYGAEAMNLIGGRLAERWHAALREVLTKHQNSAGFWPAVDAWSTPGANVHSTACALLALTATY
jgi:beta-lactamase regulating signal transducer with metallopeptidase domain